MGSRAGYGNAGDRRPQKPPVGQMHFEYDSNKSASNKKKHGIDFEEAQKLWKDNRKIENTLPYSEETRTMTIGQIDGKHYSAITTVRNGIIRIISVRRSRENEVKQYETTTD
jgi:uncharacterized DUF497 family protein